MNCNSKNMKLIAVCFIGIGNLIGIAYMCVLVKSGELLSISHASEYLFPLLKQAVIVNLFSIGLIAWFALKLRSDFPSELWLQIKGKKQIVSVSILIGVLVVMTIVGIAVKKDPVMVLCNLFYYIFFIAFMEEFVFRGVSCYLLDDFSRKVKYFLPNIIFAGIHIFAYNEFEAFALNDIVNFFTSDFLGLFLGGCIFLYLKEKSGTLWVPILVHGIMDFYGIFLD